MIELGVDLVGWLLSSVKGLLGYVVPFLFVLTIVVFFHELGHFLVARWCGVKVESFSIGFGRALLAWKDRKGTVWKIGWLPLGGYVRFLGDEDVVSRASREGLDALGSRDREHSFHFKPLHQRAFIVSAGPVANFLLAVLIFALLFTIVGEVRIPPRVDLVKPGSPAEAAGFKPGDLIVAVDGRRIESFGKLQEIESLSAGRTLTIEVEREGRHLTLTAAPAEVIVRDRLGNDQKIGRLGLEKTIPPRIANVKAGSSAEAGGLRAGDEVAAINGQKIVSFEEIQAVIRANPERKLAMMVKRDGRTLEVQVVPEAKTARSESGGSVVEGYLGIEAAAIETEFVRHDPVSALWHAGDRTLFIIERTLAYVGGLIVGKENAEHLSGPVGIAILSGQVAQIGFIDLVNLAAILSISIGLLNLFPIPMLDGGHLLYYAVEAVRGRPLGEKAQELGFRLGLALVLSLMLFATWNDLAKLRIFG